MIPFFYKRSGAETGIPLVLIHGGPGLPSGYLATMEQLSDTVPVIRYDQRCVGASAAMEKPPLWSIELFVDELHALVRAEAPDGAILLGHSWGAIVAFEFAKRFPALVRKIIFASPSLAIPLWREDSRRLRRKLGMQDLIVLNHSESQGDFESVPYRAALDRYYRRFVYGPMAEQDRAVFSSLSNINREQYRTMWGPNELVIDGMLADYDARASLSELECPTLFTCGRDDEATPESCESLSRSIPRSTVSVFEESAHHPHLTAREAYLECIKRFALAAS